MSIDWNIPLAEAGDQLLRAALENAHAPALMATLTHFTGNTDHLNGSIQPDVVQFAEEEDGLAEEQRQAARALAFDVLKNYRDRGCPALDRPPADAVETANAWSTSVWDQLLG